MSIDPRTVLITTPTHDGNIAAECAAGLIQAGGLYASWFPLRGCSEVNLARNLIAQQFIESPFEVMVCLDADIGFSRRDFELLLEGDEDCVVAEYKKKDGTGKPVEFGLGFARIHKRVFEAMLSKLVTLPDGVETVAINYFMWQGQMVGEFYPSFATPTHHWSGEDHSFWKLAQMAGASVRIERRTMLQHLGRSAFQYHPPGVDDYSVKLTE